jgi:hypothetical protein
MPFTHPHYAWSTIRFFILHRLFWSIFFIQLFWCASAELQPWAPSQNKEWINVLFTDSNVNPHQPSTMAYASHRLWKTYAYYNTKIISIAFLCPPQGNRCVIWCNLSKLYFSKKWHCFYWVLQIHLTCYLNHTKLKENTDLYSYWSSLYLSE